MTKILLSQLVVSEHNVRVDSPDDPSIDTLEASIRRRGLLQPLLVYPLPDNQFGVAAGKRRLTALKRIFGDDHEVHPDWIMEIPESAALGASVAENYVRKQMDTKELYGAFRRLSDDEGLGVEEIAQELGYDINRVRRILRLAHLHPELMEAWNAGEFGDEEAHAIAFLDDQDLQLRVAKKVRKEYTYGKAEGWRALQRMAHVIKRQARDAIKGKDFDARKLAYIGIEAYKEAGGRIYDDLFGNDPVILNSELVEKLADQKLADEQAEALTRVRRADGSELNIEWVGEDQLPKINLYGYDQIDTECAIQPEVEGEGETATAIVPTGGKILFTAFISHDGESGYRAYWASREDGGIPLPKQRNQKTSAPATTVEKSPGVKLKEADGAASRNAFLALQVLFADSVVDSLMTEAIQMPGTKDETLGLEALLFMLAWSVQRQSAITGFPRFHEPERGPHQVKELLYPGEVSFKHDLRKHLDNADWLEAKTLVEGWDGYRGWISTNRAAVLGAALVRYLWSPVANNFREEPRPQIVELVAETTGCIIAESLKAIDLITHKARVAAMREWGVPEDHLKTLKAKTSAQFMRDVIVDKDKRKLLGVDDAKATAWAPAMLKVSAVERPKPKATKPKVTKANGKKTAKQPEPDTILAT